VQVLRLRLPFNIPRYGADDKVTKCHLCFDRVDAGRLPACAQACPTQTLQFGGREALIAKAKAGGRSCTGRTRSRGWGRLRARGQTRDVRPAGGPVDPDVDLPLEGRREAARDPRLLGSVAAVVVHYVTFGSRRLEEDGRGREGTRMGKYVERFNTAERVLHWFVAASFLTLLLSGLGSTPASSTATSTCSGRGGAILATNTRGRSFSSAP